RPAIRPLLRNRVPYWPPASRLRTSARPPRRKVLAVARPRSLTGRIVVITGAGRGIGAATARAVGRAGARVALADLDGDLAAAVAADVGDGSLGRAVDVTDHAAYAAFLDEVERELGPIDVLINNAGVMLVTEFA